MPKKKRISQIKDSSQRLREKINDVAFTNNYNSGRKFFRHFNRDAISSLAADLGGNYYHIYNSNGRTPFCCEAPCVRYKCCDINCPIKENINNTYASFGTSDLETGANQDAPIAPSFSSSSKNNSLSFNLNDRKVVKKINNNYLYPRGVVNICKKNIHFYLYHYPEVHLIKEINIEFRINKKNVIKEIRISKFAEKYLLEQSLNSNTEEHELIDIVTKEEKPDGYEYHQVSGKLKGKYLSEFSEEYSPRHLILDIVFFDNFNYQWEANIEFLQCVGINDLDNNLTEHIKLIDKINIKNCYEVTSAPKYILKKYCNGDLTLFYNGEDLNSKYYQYLDYLIITFENKINLLDYECQIEGQDIIFQDPIIFEDSIILKTDPDYRVYIRKNTEELILSGLPNTDITNYTRIFMTSTNDPHEEPISFGVFPPNNYLEIINEICDSSYADLCNDYDPCNDPCNNPCNDTNLWCTEEILKTINSTISLFLRIMQLIIIAYKHENNCCLVKY